MRKVRVLSRCFFPAIGVALLSAGCGSLPTLQATIPPSELPKMNGHYYFRAGGQRYFSTIKFKTVDGTTKEVGRPAKDKWAFLADADPNATSKAFRQPGWDLTDKQGELEAQVVMKDGSRYDFSHPVESKYKQGHLAVAGGDSPAAKPLEKW